MFRNRKVILPSVAIVLTLIVCSILVNFALANSGTPANGNNANSVAKTALTGYTNIDLAVMASNDAGKKATGEDKYRIVQILPNSMSSYATADQAMTAKVTAPGYSGRIRSEADYSNTSSLWKYVYDGEYFRYAVFNGYKTIAANMAEGAVQLTTATVSELNSMDTNAQEILASADFIYIAAFKASDYSSVSADISEDLYNWLDVFATVDRHPVVIDWYALCTDDPTSITGNNDTFRMGTLAYKLMTVSLLARYNNVLVTEPDFFWELFQEAENNAEIPPMTDTNRTLSDFILTAERTATEGGRNYIGSNTYYKWYSDETFENFVDQNSKYRDSLYARIGTRTEARPENDQSGKRTSWDYDNAKILIISENTTSAMFNQFKDMNDAPGGAAYSYNRTTGVWEIEHFAQNSELTDLLYFDQQGYPYVPSGANIFLLEGTGDNLIDAIDGQGTPFVQYDLAGSHFKDVKTISIKGSVIADEQLPMDADGNYPYMMLMVQDSAGVYHVAEDANGAMIMVPLMNEVDLGDGSYSYEYSFDNLNDFYTYEVIFNDTRAGLTRADFGRNGLDFDVLINSQNQKAGYDYDAVCTWNDADDEDQAGGPYKPGAYDHLGPTKADPADPDYYYYVSLPEDAEDQVEAFVDQMYDIYEADLIASLQGPQQINLLDYDVVFIDAGSYSEEIGEAVYQALCAAVEAGVYFIVTNEAGDGVGSANSGGGGSIGGGTIVNSPSAKAIADIINAGVYRDGADNKFRVLEIQPCYPIDEELAAGIKADGKQPWSKHSDGSAITGNYYTIPSDVVEGRAQEELPTLKTEYYDFDLTKAKIAYAIDGVEYSDIELTQVSTEALIGMQANISATYDLIYIGGDFSAMDRTVDEIYTSDIFGYIGPSAAQLAKGIPTFLMYYHTGSLREIGERGAYRMVRATNDNIYPARDGSNMLATPYVGSKAYKTTYLAENGNDLTLTKYDELVAYIAAGRPIMVSNELTSVYDKMTDTSSGSELSFTQLMMGYWYNNGKLERGNIYLDPSSRMYKLLGILKTRATGANAYNVIWGFDPSDANTKMIENTDRTYGDTLYTYNPAAGIVPDATAQAQGWYNNADTIKKFAVVYSKASSDAIHNLVVGSAQRTRLTLLSKPTKYIQGIEATYLRTPNLSFTFTVEGPLKGYNYALYVDKDKNTVFDEDNDYYMNGVISSGEEKTVNMVLDSDFFGAASWYLEITDGNGNVVASQTGVSKIINLTDGISQINVLQIQTMSEGQDASSWTATDTLYFDIQSQTAHKILRYNSYANQTQLDNVSAQQYTPLGRHEVRFGIVEYDMSILNDDYLSNLADAITDDYEVNLDMVVASPDKATFKTGDGVTDSYDCFDTWVKEADTLASGGNVDGHNQAWYQSQVNAALMDYSNKAAAVDAPKAELDAYLRGAIQSLQGTYTGPYNYGYRGQYQTFFGGIQQNIPANEVIELLEYMIDTSEYYMIFWPMYSTNTDMAFTNGSDNITSSFGQDFIRLFKAYRDAKNAELDAKDVYQTYLRRSYGSDFMKKMYSILILGPSDSFGGFKVDMSPLSCQYILDYVRRGGDLFFFHDTMTPFSTAGAVNLTESLMGIVGMNRFHVDFTNQANTYTQINPGYASDYSGPTPAGYFKGVVQEDGWAYAPKDNDYYNIAHNWNTAINGWEDIGEQEYHNQWGGVSRATMYRKQLAPGTTGYYVYQGPSAGGDPIFSGTYSDIKYNNDEPDKYYMTPYAFYTDGGVEGLINSINRSMKDYDPSLGSWAMIPASKGMYVSALSMTPLYYEKNGGGTGQRILPYIYAQSDFQTATTWSASAKMDQSVVSQVVNAKQLNEGLVTLYPFSIGNTLNISGTHQQAYALDLERENVTVWYTLSGSNNSNTPKIRSSMYAADPYDAMENYFIYTTSYYTGTITYCGAGHCSVTGPSTKNNDERKLFINVIVNSAEAVTPKPSIRVFEPDGTFENEMERDEEISATTGKTVYKDKVDSKTDTPDFDFNVNIPEDVDISMINIYYDLDYDEDFLNTRPTYNAATDVMVKSYTTQDELKNVGTRFRDMVRDANTNNKLQLRDEYFTPYGGNYTYIVLEVYYVGSAKPVYVMIKITVSDPLFELTQSITDAPVSVDAIAEEKFVLV